MKVKLFITRIPMINARNPPWDPGCGIATHATRSLAVTTEYKITTKLQKVPESNN
jgi:hypothetical protein